MPFCVIRAKAIPVLAAALLVSAGPIVVGPGQAVAGGSVISEACEGGVVPLAIVVPEDGFHDGCQQHYVLKNGAGKGTRGTFGLVDLPPCPEGPCSNSGTHDGLECELTYGNLCCRGPEMIGVELSLLQGDHAGPYLRAMLARWNGDTDHRAGICHATYVGNGNRLARVVVVEATGRPGSRAVRVVGFAEFFLRNLPMRPGDDLEGEFLPVE